MNDLLPKDCFGNIVQVGTNLLSDKGRGSPVPVAIIEKIENGLIWIQWLGFTFHKGPYPINFSSFAASSWVRWENQDITATNILW